MLLMFELQIQLTTVPYRVPIPEQAAHDSGMMPPTDSEMISPTVPR